MKFWGLELTKLLYTVKETAALLSFSEQVILAFLDEGKLRGHRHNGKTVRITRDSIIFFCNTFSDQEWEGSQYQREGNHRRVGRISNGVNGQ